MRYSHAISEIKIGNANADISIENDYPILIINLIKNKNRLFKLKNNNISICESDNVFKNNLLIDKTTEI